MSAYIVGRNHIRFLVEAALHLERGATFRWWDTESHELTGSNGTEVGQMLWVENRASVSYRYPHDDWKELPGPVNEDHVYFHEGAPFKFSPTPAQILKAADCYSYQTCEHPEWEQSSAHAFIEALIKRAYTLTPGYEEAPWGAPQMA